MNVARHDSRNWAKTPIRSAMVCASSTAINCTTTFGATIRKATTASNRILSFGAWATFNVAQAFLAVELGQRGLL